MSDWNDHGGTSGMSRTFFNRILELVYPDGLYCICCGKIIDSSRPYRLCNECMDEINWAAGRTCVRCGKPLSDLNPSDTCYNCREQDHVFRRGYACAGYGSCERAMIFALKYGERTDIAPTMGEVLHDRMVLLHHTGSADLSQYDMVIPVPMYEPKRRRRGFNQAELIAREFCRRSGLPLAPRAVARVRDTHAMKGV
ncbi:MAG: ComF family protein, partial [Mogibacterium sp.]|nr:ComF family protein [Mogibacterium sp.]